MAREIWLVRHGETASNRDGIVQGHTDVPLSEVGEAQAQKLAEWLVGHGPEFGAVVCSPLSRAARTGELLAAGLGIGPPDHDRRWMEAHFGDFEGGPGRALREFRARGEDLAIRTPPPGGGESMLALSARVTEALQDLVEREVERVLVATHGGPISAAVCHVLGLPFGPSAFQRFRRDNTGLTVLRQRTSAPGTLQVAQLNALPHRSRE